MITTKGPQERKTTTEWDDGKQGDKKQKNKLNLPEIFPSMHEI